MERAALGRVVAHVVGGERLGTGGTGERDEALGEGRIRPLGRGQGEDLALVVGERILELEPAAALAGAALAPGQERAQPAVGRPVGGQHRSEVPQASPSRQPTTRRRPQALAATCARTMPARLSRSVSARPASPSACACQTSPSGGEAPRRKLKCEIACSSA